MPALDSRPVELAKGGLEGRSEEREPPDELKLVRWRTEVVAGPLKVFTVLRNNPVDKEGGRYLLETVVVLRKGPLEFEVFERPLDDAVLKIEPVPVRVASDNKKLTLLLGPVLATRTRRRNHKQYIVTSGTGCWKRRALGTVAKWRFRFDEESWEVLGA